MIQRIQTIYLFIFIVILFFAAFSPFAEIINNLENPIILTPNGWSYEEGHNPLYLGYLVSITFAILMLVSYKNRKKQLRYGKLSYLIVIITLVYMIMLVNVEDANKVNYLYGMYLLVSSLPFMFLANRSIKKDEDLVRSLDRLR